MIQIKESLKGEHPERKEQEGEDKAGVRYIQLTYHTRFPCLSDLHLGSIPSKVFPPSFFIVLLAFQSGSGKLHCVLALFPPIGSCFSSFLYVHTTS